MTKNISKRILLVLLSMSIAVSMMPFGVLAAEDGVGTAETTGGTAVETENPPATPEKPSEPSQTPEETRFVVSYDPVSANCKQINLYWEPVKIGMDGETPIYAHNYRVLMKKADGEYKELSSAQIDAFYTYSEGGAFLAPGAYFFKVEAWADGGTEPAVISEELEVGVPAEGEIPTPQKLKSYSTYNGIDLEWNPVHIEGKTVKYNVYKKLASKKEYQLYKKQISATKLYVKIPYKYLKNKYSFVVTAVCNGKESAISNERVDQSVRTISYGFTLKESRKLTCHCGGHKKTVTFKAGRKITTCDGFSQGLYYFYDNGHKWRVKRISVKDQKVTGGKYNLRYTKSEAERYVNRRGLKSGTNYLIWTNLYGQHLYVFKGSKGNWKLYDDWQISTGKPSTPTSTGVTEIKKKNPYYHALKHWSLCYVFSFHSKHKSWPIGKGPKSGGCVRNAPENAAWIYYNCPIRTGVCIY